MTLYSSQRSDTRFCARDYLLAHAAGRAHELVLIVNHVPKNSVTMTADGLFSLKVSLLIRKFLPTTVRKSCFTRMKIASPLTFLENSRRLRKFAVNGGRLSVQKRTLCNIDGSESSQLMVVDFPSKRERFAP